MNTTISIVERGCDAVLQGRLAGLVLVAIVMMAAVPVCGRPVSAAEPAPRAARSVHLGYGAKNVAVFCIEMTVLESTRGSFFMAAGWNTGYLGLQELGDGRKVVIFSVWDPTRGDDPDTVAEEERVECLHIAPGMRIKRFGGEGTGGQCLGAFPWKTGERHRFAVTATPLRTCPSPCGRATEVGGHTIAGRGLPASAVVLS